MALQRCTHTAKAHLKQMLLPTTTTRITAIITITNTTVNDISSSGKW